MCSKGGVGLSFWNSREHKAKKEHRCIYCGKKIEIGETYSRETGTFEGEFNDYCLCLRCVFAIDKFEEKGEYLGDFYETIFNEGLLVCPSCGTTNLREYSFSKDAMTCECECDNCDEKWVADLSIEGIKEIIQLTT